MNCFKTPVAIYTGLGIINHCHSSHWLLFLPLYVCLALLMKSQVFLIYLASSDKANGHKTLLLPSLLQLKHSRHRFVDTHAPHLRIYHVKKTEKQG